MGGPKEDDPMHGKALTLQEGVQYLCVACTQRVAGDDETSLRRTVASQRTSEARQGLHEGTDEATVHAKLSLIAELGEDWLKVSVDHRVGSIGGASKRQEDHVFVRRQVSLGHEVGGTARSLVGREDGACVRLQVLLQVGRAPQPLLVVRTPDCSNSTLPHCSIKVRTWARRQLARRSRSRQGRAVLCSVQALCTVKVRLPHRRKGRSSILLLSCTNL
jgi:hypothetical protein